MFDSNAQDNGALLAVHDEGNEHVLYVWDWQKQKKVAESKVRLSLSLQVQSAFDVILCAFKSDNVPRIVKITRQSRVYCTYAMNSVDALLLLVLSLFTKASFQFQFC